MTCCLNPACHNPQHPDGTQFCSHCGTPLVVLKDRYRPIKSIGSGGFGKTYLAEDMHKLNEKCVIKQFAPIVQGAAALQKATELFEQEAEQLQKLGEHPQIPTLLAYFEENSCLYLIQQFIDGQNLLAELQQQGIFHEKKTRKVLVDLLNILVDVHAQKVIHRDIKPENIIRRRTDNKLVLIDFGASKSLKATVMSKQATRIGSFGYASLEQMEEGRIYPTSDLYSVGATCFHLLTGIHPWELWKRQGYSWVNHWRQHLQQPVSRELGRVLDKLLQEDYHQRYASAAEVLQALNPPPPPPPPPLKPNNLPLWGAGILFGFAGFLFWQSRTPVNRDAPQPSSTFVSTPQPINSPQPILTPVISGITLADTFQGHSMYGFVYSVAFNPDGNMLASGSGDETIQLWNMATKEQIQTFGGHSSFVYSVAFSPNGKMLASGSGDHTIKLWDVTTGELISTLKGHSQDVKSVTFSPDGKTLASGSWDKTIKLWDVSTGELIRTLTGHSDGVNSVAFSPDSKTLASGSVDNTIKLWNVSSKQKTRTLTGHPSWVNSVAFSPDGKTLASGSWDKTIKLWDVATGELIHTFTNHSNKHEVDSIAFSPDGRILASGGRDKTIKLWDVATRKEIRTLTEHSSYISSVAFSPDGKTLASGSNDKTIKIWRIEYSPKEEKYDGRG